MNNCHEKIKKKWEDICRKIRCWSDRSLIINGIIFLLIIFLAPILFKLFPYVYVVIALALALAVLFGLFILFYRYLLLFIGILTLISSIFIPFPYDIVIFLIVSIGLFGFLYFRYFLLYFIVILAFISLLLFALGVSIKLELLGDVNCLIIQKLCNLFVEEESVYTLMNVGIAFGGLVTLLLYQRRNQAVEKQTKTQYETFNQDKQFSNYLEATKLLTDKKSTPDAKIAAMFLLAGVAKDHPKDVGRIIQVINQELIPLINCVNAKYEKNNSSKSNGKVRLKHTEKDRKIIKEWRHNGDDNERIFSTALYIIKKILLGLQSSNTNVDISNTIIFDVDTAFGDKIPSIDKNILIESLIFFHCQLKEENFIKTNYHFCKFINCDLEKANFDDANLWGTSFIRCDLEGVKFEGNKKAKCEGVEFENCKNLTLEQLEQMKFENLKDAKGYEFENIQNVRLSESKNKGKNKGKNKESYSKKDLKDLKYLVVIDEETREEINNSIKEKNKKLTNEEKNEELEMENFITRNEYKKWKNSPKIDNGDKNKKSSRK